MPWERLQEGPEEPLTDNLDNDILLTEGRSHRNQPPWMERLLRHFSTWRFRYWIIVSVTALILVTLVPFVIVLGNHSSDVQENKVVQPLALPETSTPFLEPFEFDNSSAPFSPPDTFYPLPLLDFFYDYLTILQSNVTDGPAEVTVFYESLSIPSREFLAHQFFPTYFNVTPRFNVKLVPFGHAEFTIYQGTEKLKCEHFEDECQGNMVQACAIRHTNWNQTQSIDRLMKFIQCLMADTGKGGNILDTDADKTGIHCATTTDLNWNPIFNCTQTHEGIVILKMFEQTTNSQNVIRKQDLPVVQVKGYTLTPDEKKNFAHFIERRLVAQTL